MRIMACFWLMLTFFFLSGHTFPAYAAVKDYSYLVVSPGPIYDYVIVATGAGENREDAVFFKFGDVNQSNVNKRYSAYNTDNPSFDFAALLVNGLNNPQENLGTVLTGYIENSIGSKCGISRVQGKEWFKSTAVGEVRDLQLHISQEYNGKRITRQNLLNLKTQIITDLCPGS